MGQRASMKQLIKCKQKWTYIVLNLDAKSVAEAQITCSGTTLGVSVKGSCEAAVLAARVPVAKTCSLPYIRTDVNRQQRRFQHDEVIQTNHKASTLTIVKARRKLHF